MEQRDLEYFVHDNNNVYKKLVEMPTTEKVIRIQKLLLQTTTELK